ncbi:MAG: hypothetical protein C0608_06560 [Deltaproteobacteria bacterium]|nr:MAG: hypothetical protein C0608_06560 [Deltaproteobacteria bacterium]
MFLNEEEIFFEVPLSPQSEEYLDTLVPLKAGLYLDPGVVEEWSCDPKRCRPALGRNLCCKVELRCAHLDSEGLCKIHRDKPFCCDLFPLELLHIGNARCVVSAKDPFLYQMNWSRFDRDMLRCFDGEVREGRPIFEVALPLLEEVLTASEVAVLKRGYQKLLASESAA